jgi:hypothetical protein
LNNTPNDVVDDSNYTVVNNTTAFLRLPHCVDT